MAFQRPPPDFIRYWYPDLLDFVNRVNWAYQECPFTVSSWWRSQDDNARVGGDPYSQHLIGTGMDAVPISPWRKDHLSAALRRAGLIAVDSYPRHVHAQLYPAGFLRAWLA